MKPLSPITYHNNTLSFCVMEGEVRNLRVGNHQLVQRIYMAVRDQNWNTVPGKEESCVQNLSSHSFTLTQHVVHQHQDIHFAWDGTITSQANEVTFEFVGEALSSFLKNRIGFCLLIPAEHAGATCLIEYADASASTTAISPKLHVLIASRSFGKNCPEVLEQLRAAGCQLEGFDLERAPTEEELLQRIGPAHVLVSGTEPVTARVLQAASQLKLIAKHGVGYENIDLEAAKARQIPVTVTGDAIAESVAELAFGFMLALARWLPQGNAAVQAGQWRRFVGTEIYGKALGIVGLGQIGKTLCRRAKAFEMKVLATEAQPDMRFVQSWGVELLPLDALLTKADFVSLHVPVTPQTHKLIGQQQLALMKRTAYLINTSRGELVDEEALYNALQQGVIAGAASDVFVNEPPGEHPLLQLPNFIAMPHCGGQTEEGLRRMGESVANNILRVLRGQEPLYRIA